jgi:hypothetical protein
MQEKKKTWKIKINILTCKFCVPSTSLCNGGWVHAQHLMIMSTALHAACHTYRCRSNQHKLLYSMDHSVALVCIHEYFIHRYIDMKIYIDTGTCMGTDARGCKIMHIYPVTYRPAGPIKWHDITSSWPLMWAVLSEQYHKLNLAGWFNNIYGAAGGPPKTIVYYIWRQ